MLDNLTVYDTIDMHYPKGDFCIGWCNPLHGSQVRAGIGADRNDVFAVRYDVVEVVLSIGESCQEAIAKLNTIISSSLKKPKARKKSKPNKASIKKRLESKKKHSEKKQMRRRID